MASRLRVGKAMHRATEYLRQRVSKSGVIKRPNFKYLRTSPDWDSLYAPLMQRYMESVSGE